MDKNKRKGQISKNRGGRGSRAPVLGSQRIPVTQYVEKIKDTKIGESLRIGVLGQSGAKYNLLGNTNIPPES